MTISVNGGMICFNRMADGYIQAGRCEDKEVWIPADEITSMSEQATLTKEDGLLKRVPYTYIKTKNNNEEVGVLASAADCISAYNQARLNLNGCYLC